MRGDLDNAKDQIRILEDQLNKHGIPLRFILSLFLIKLYRVIPAIRETKFLFSSKYIFVQGYIKKNYYSEDL